MGRKVDVDHLVDATQIAERLGLADRRSVHQLRVRHPDFPAEVATFPKTTLWVWPDVERWARETGRLP